ncbi:MAG: 4-(cytidine 5'-diphospho)-2-C-methyl-D-erythritol kinase, partial [Clostridia bacterium]|nr:4-(cytidine 5'-diphospho)-2-C-methyl-D-erythritol kinase [Clostridia bacterium]
MIEIKAHAKLNLSLDVVGKRPDGYHNLCSIMQSVRLADDITIRRNPDISILCDAKYVPMDQQNTAYRAAKLFLDEAKQDGGVSIRIRKRIPVGGGMGGGSADAAAVLMGMNKLFGYPFSFKKLKEIGLRCGADVPFCMTGGTCLAEGLGEILTPLPAMPRCSILLVRPRFPLNTKQMFSGVKMDAITCHPDTEGIINAVYNRDLKGICDRMYNNLEAFVPRKEIAIYKELLQKNDAMGALMTGSGSVVFGIFSSFEKARIAAEAFRALPVHTYITTPLA